jgi:hypothetical protein
VARCTTVHETIAATSCHLACFQETKLRHIDAGLATYLGTYKLKSFAFKPSRGSRGGILILWDDNFLDAENIQIGRYSLSAQINVKRSNTSFRITTVYRPMRSNEKKCFS